MKTALTTGLFLAMVCWGQAMEVTIDSMEAFRWKHRIILVLTDGRDKDSSTQMLTEAQGDLEERHVLWFCADADSVATNYRAPLPSDLQPAGIQRYRRAPKAETEVILIGKDGGVKYRGPKLNLEEIFALIDSMPMRRLEMAPPPRPQRGP